MGNQGNSGSRRHTRWQQKSLKNRPRGCMGQLQLVRGQLPQTCPGGTQTGTKWMWLPIWTGVVSSQTGPRALPRMAQFSAFGKGEHEAGAPSLRTHTPGVGTPVMNTDVQVSHCEREASQLCTQAALASRARVGRQLLPTHSKLAPGQRTLGSGKSENLLERGS